MSSIEIITGTEDELDKIQPLWEKLNALHARLSPGFGDRYRKMTWITRKQKLLAKSKEMLFEYATCGNQQVIGYCISTIEKHDPSAGEIDSVFIDEDYRKSGLGHQFLNRAILWMNAKDVKTQKLLVGVGNEEVLEFYRQFDFHPLHIVLQRIEK